MRLFLRYEFPYVRLAGPALKTLEVFRLESGKRSRLDAFSENERVCAEPLEAIEIEPAVPWAE